jgi:hypothetical protein
MLNVDLVYPKKTRSFTHNCLLGSMPLMPQVMKERTKKWAVVASQQGQLS